MGNTLEASLIELVEEDLNTKMEDARTIIRGLKNDKSRFRADPGIAIFTALASASGYDADFSAEATGRTIEETFKKLDHQVRSLNHGDWGEDGRMKSFYLAMELPHSQIYIPFETYEQWVPDPMLDWVREAQSKRR